METKVNTKTKIRYGDLKKLIHRLHEEVESHKLHEEEAGDPEPFAPASKKTEVGDSVDVQIDRFLNEYEQEAMNSKTEGMDYRRITQRIIREASGVEGEVADHDGAMRSVDDLDVESFANSVNRLIENFESLLEIRNTIMRRALNHLIDSYDDEVKAAFEETMREQHGISLGQSQKDIEDEQDHPAAERAGPGLPGEGGGA